MSMMSENKYSEDVLLSDFSAWKKVKSGRSLSDLHLEITARCNNNCRHCYINLEAGDCAARKKELSLSEIQNIVDQAVDMGAGWCLLTGGEPLLREDFFDIYMHIKRRGLLVQLFTNANLVTEKHARLFGKYPPRQIEVTVYGSSQGVYEQVTQKPGSYKAFLRGIRRLEGAGLRVRYKAMALRSNVHEIPDIARFCRERTAERFRFDPFLHLRLDRDARRNQEIISERLSPEEIAVLDQMDSERSTQMLQNCNHLVYPGKISEDDHLFMCYLGQHGATVGYDGTFYLCASLCHPDFVCDLRTMSLRQAWEKLFELVSARRVTNPEFVKKCGQCVISNLCASCGAHAYLETGDMEKPVDYFCDVAQARAAWLKRKVDK